jgi:exonuclease SbcC
MKIHSIKARGFIGLQRGLGLEEVSLDLSKLSGLVALSGPNGAGKTSFLELLHPFRTLASRKKALQHHVFLRDSHKDLTFSLNGDTYRTLVKIDSQSGKQEGFIWRNGEPQVDGKCPAYDAYIEDLLGSAELFFASVFAAQNSKKLNEMTTGQLKELMTEFLRLDELVRHEQTSKAVANMLSAELERARASLKALEQRLEEVRMSAADLQEAKAKAEDLAEKRRKIAEEIGRLERNAEELRVKIGTAESIKAGVEQLRKQKAEIQAEKESTEKDGTKALRDLKSKHDGIDQRIKAARDLAKKKPEIDEAEGKKAETQKVLEAKEKELGEASEALEKARDDYHKALGVANAAKNAGTDMIEATRAASDEAQEDLNVARQLLQDRKIRTATYRNPDLEALESKLEYTEKQAADLEKRDPDCTSTTCAFIKTALEARDALPALREEAEKARAKDLEKRAEIKKQVTAAEKEVEALKEVHIQKSLDHSFAKALAVSREKKRGEVLGEFERARTSLARKRDALQEDLAGLKEKVKGFAQLLQDKDRVVAAEQEITLLEEQIQDVSDQVKKQIADTADKVSRYDKQLEQVTTDLEAKEKALKESEQAETSLKENNRRIEEEKARRTATDQEIEQQGKAIAVLEVEAGKLPDLEAEEKTVRARVETINADIAEWRYLQTACGANGLRALEIDSVAPLVTGIGNDLLLSTFGPGHTLKFRTQDDEGRECLDILSIQEDGREILLDNLSGGQKVWSLKALRLALTLLAKEKSQKLFGTAFADEEDGALDIDHAQEFIRLYRAFMRTGGFETCLYISHKPECVSMADNVLRFQPGTGIEVE